MWLLSNMMETLLKAHYQLPRQQKTWERHRNSNITIISVLGFAIDGGIAPTVLKKHEDSQDGNLAWLNLHKWHERQGSKNIISNYTLHIRVVKT